MTEKIEPQQFFSISEVAARWRCSRATVYERLRRAGAVVLDFARPGRRGKKAIPLQTLLEIEAQRLKRLR